MSKWTKQTYDLVSEVINAERSGVGAPQHALLDHMALRLAEQFKADNARFNKARFLEAAGVER